MYCTFYFTVLSVGVEFVQPDLPPSVTAMSGLGVYRCRTAEAIRQKLNKESCLHIEPVNSTRADCTVPQARQHRKLLMESDQQNMNILHKPHTPVRPQSSAGLLLIQAGRSLLNSLKLLCLLYRAAKDRNMMNRSIQALAHWKLRDSEQCFHEFRITVFSI